MTAKTYDPNGLYRCLKPIRRTTNTVQGQPKTAKGNMIIMPPAQDADGNEVETAVLFTMADRSPAQIKMLVEEKGVIAPVEAKK